MCLLYALYMFDSHILLELREVVEVLLLLMMFINQSLIATIFLLPAECQWLEMVQGICAP